MIRLPHSFVLLSLTVLGLASCSGPKGASSKRATPAAAEKPSAATGGAPATADTTPAAAAESPPPSDPNASRDAFWNLAMQRYKPPAPASQPPLADLPEPARTSTDTAVIPTPTVSTTPAMNATPAQDLNPADIPYATWAPGKRGVVKSPFDPSGRLIDVRDFNAGQMSQCPYTGKIFRVPPLK